MTNIVGELYENNRGEFFIKVTDDDQLLDYCESQDDIYTHETIQDLYERLELSEYMDADRMIAIHRANKINQELDAMRNK